MLSEYLNLQFTWLEFLDFVLRIVLAMACGGVIGYERSRRFKGAGIRTHMIVACAAALMMIVSKYAFADLVGAAGETMAGTKGTDPARIAAQVVSGISFLGAGVIFKNNGSVSGLTTAAGLWATGGIGLAMGSGMYFLGIFTTLLIAFFQFLLHKFKVGADSMPLYQLSFSIKGGSSFEKDFKIQLESWGTHIIDTKMVKSDKDLITYDISLRASAKLSTQEILSFFSEREDVVSVSVLMP